jgi:ribosomal protein L7Ae-like RNA K-turn-binding protein
LVAGSEAVLKAIRTSKASLVVVSEDAGEATVRRFVRECERSHVPLVRAGHGADLGRMTGRRAVSVIAIADRSMAAALVAKLGVSRPRDLSTGTEKDKGEVDV